MSLVTFQSDTSHSNHTYSQDNIRSVTGPTELGRFFHNKLRTYITFEIRKQIKLNWQAQLPRYAQRNHVDCSMLESTIFVQRFAIGITVKAVQAICAITAQTGKHLHTVHYF